MIETEARVLYSESRLYILSRQNGHNVLKQLAAIFRCLNSGCFEPNVGYIMLKINFPRENIWLILRRVS